MSTVLSKKTFKDVWFTTKYNVSVFLKFIYELNKCHIPFAYVAAICFCFEDKTWYDANGESKIARNVACFTICWGMKRSMQLLNFAISEHLINLSMKITI